MFKKRLACAIVCISIAIYFWQKQLKQYQHLIYFPICRYILYKILIVPKDTYIKK